MKHSSFWAYSMTLLLALGFLSSGAAPSKASEIFNFAFDGQGLTGVDGITPPVVGTGSLSFSNNVGTGIFALSALGTYTMSFTIGGETFTDADIATPLNEVAVNIFSSGSGDRLEFTENPTANPVDTGPSAGSVDFLNGTGGVLSFEPSYAGGNFEYYTVADAGNYLATNSVPEPSTLTLLGAALIGFGAFSYRKRA